MCLFRITNNLTFLEMFSLFNFFVRTTNHSNIGWFSTHMSKRIEKQRPIELSIYSYDATLEIFFKVFFAPCPLRFDEVTVVSK